MLAVWGTRAFAIRDTQDLDKKKNYPELGGCDVRGSIHTPH